MSRWRPKDWVNPYKNKKDCWEWQCFERGADDMLEAVKKNFKIKLGVNDDGEIYNTITADWLVNNE